MLIPPRQSTRDSLVLNHHNHPHADTIIRAQERGAVEPSDLSVAGTIVIVTGKAIAVSLFADEIVGRVLFFRVAA